MQLQIISSKYYHGKKLKSAKNKHICLMAVLVRCFIRQPPVQDDQ